MLQPIGYTPNVTQKPRLALLCSSYCKNRDSRGEEESQETAGSNRRVTKERSESFKQRCRHFGLKIASCGVVSMGISNMARLSVDGSSYQYVLCSEINAIESQSETSLPGLCRHQRFYPPFIFPQRFRKMLIKIVLLVQTKRFNYIQNRERLQKIRLGPKHKKK